MIGVSSIWPKAVFLLIFIGFLTVFVGGWLEVAKGKAAFSWKLLFGSIFVLLWGFLFIQVFVREAVLHHDLAGLRPEAIESIEIGNRTLTNPNSIAEVVDSLAAAEWFEVNHGGWAGEVPLVLHFRSGEQRTYHVAYYLRQEGAVLISMSNFDRAGKGFGWSNGVAFCPQLPSVLAVSGVFLPGEGAEQHNNQKEQSGTAVSATWSAKVVPIAIFGIFTLGALTVFQRLIRGKDSVSNSAGSAYPGLKLVATLGELALVTLIAAGSGLRVMYALFDWPDPTSFHTILCVWLALFSGGSVYFFIYNNNKL